MLRAARNNRQDPARLRIEILASRARSGSSHTFLTNERIIAWVKAGVLEDYDNYAAKGGMMTYSTPPPNHDSSFDHNFAKRGNITGVQTFFNMSPLLDPRWIPKLIFFLEINCLQG
jgi:hypothetical protein